MSSITYYSAIYIINRSKKVASKLCLPGYACDFLPQEIDLREFADLVANMQKICFKDENIDNENSDRLYNFFAATTDKTMAVALSLGYDVNFTDYKEFVDGGSATIQMSSQDVLSHQQPWLNEVCRSKRSTQKMKGPVQRMMKLIDKYITDVLMKRYKKVNGLYLYVEKEPEHGDPEVLLRYYPKYGFKEFFLGGEVDEEYYYMKKCYGKDLSSLRKTKTKSTRVSKKRKTNSTVKKVANI